MYSYGCINIGFVIDMCHSLLYYFDHEVYSILPEQQRKRFIIASISNHALEYTNRLMFAHQNDMVTREGDTAKLVKRLLIRGNI